MPKIAMPVSSFMTAPVVTLPETAPLSEAGQLLRERGISCLAVVDREGRPSGVISRTDILRIGRAHARSALGAAPPSRTGRRAALLSLPDGPVRDAMKRDLATVDPDTPVSAAAEAMVARRIHRVFVARDEALLGVLSTKDLLRALDLTHAARPIRDVMSVPAYTVSRTETLALATDRLERAHVTGLCVVDEDDWPVGTFTQTEALGARELDGATAVEEVMSYAMLCLHVGTPLHRAAACAYATRARRVLAVEKGRVRGVLSGLDFARAVAAG